jgi:hypothetical protein
MIINGVIIILTLINLITAGFIAYDPALQGTCSFNIWFNGSNSISSKHCMNIYINLIDNVHIIKSDDPWDGLINPNKSINQRFNTYYSCQNEIKGVQICRFIGLKMKTESIELGNELAMRITFYKGEEQVYMMSITYDASFVQDPNVKTFEEYLKWLSIE